MSLVIWLIIIFAALVAVARLRASFLTWTGGGAVALVLLGWVGLLAFWPGVVLWALFLLIAVPLNVPALRQRLLSEPLRRYIGRALPPMSETEREAIQAGTVWWESELFRGNPDWDRLLTYPSPRLGEREREFLEGPVEELCRMLENWDVTHRRNDLPAEAWDYIKRNRFFGMIIPEKYGGLGFSAYGHSQVVMKISSRAPTAGVTVMVPNSLGPAELLLEYGTETQKDYYLPRLADGREVPCFGLTSPFAGSDAGAITDCGVVCYGEHNGERVLGLRTTWEKRYITLAPVATVLGLAFRAYDPEGLLGGDEDLGITCALVPTDTPGVGIGRRHDPLGTAFQNGPTEGKDVFIPLDWIIGGQGGVGRGWTMLMECLSVGRGVSLPALGAGTGKFTTRVTGAYARVRRQFRTPIGRFEGIEEPLARIGAKSYSMDAARMLTLAALDAGEKPSVVSAMLKHYNTEGTREVINDAMDVHGGRAICDGPANYLATPYRAIPVAITVEGANILTRSMIVFGQGAMRCHPYLLQEIEAAQERDEEVAGDAFDKALFAHLGYTTRNAVRALVYGLTRSVVAPAPATGQAAKYYRRLGRMSAAFAFLADITLLVLGGELKRKEKLSGRFADAMIHMYACSAALRRFEQQGRKPEDVPVMEWAVKHNLYQVQQALDEILRNFPIKPLGIAMRWLVIFPLGRRFRYPNDRVGHKVARLLLEPSAARDRLTEGIHIDDRPDDLTGCLEHALQMAVRVEPVMARLRKAGHEQHPMTAWPDWIESLRADGILTDEEAELMQAWRPAVRRVIDVDDFDPGEIIQPVPQESAGGRPTGDESGGARKKAAAKKTGAKKTAARNNASTKKRGVKKKAAVAQSTTEAAGGSATPSSDSAPDDTRQADGKQGNE